jgi:hypothetical protein
MESVRIIKAFTKILAEKRSAFPPEALSNLSQLQEALATLPNNQPDPVANAILDWCDNYPGIRNTLRESAQQTRRNLWEQEDKEDSDPRRYALMVENLTLELKKVQGATTPQPPTPDSGNE